MDVTDKKGRVLTIRELSPSAHLDIFEACGANSGNHMWTAMALAVCAVSAIDGVPRPMPLKVSDVKARADELGFDGLNAINEAFRTENIVEADRDVAKN
ncbi:hypothetical protein FHR90_003265 [Endobacter medicaginis]|uniref:Uncharacterized protein n=1 Tax=Endobacter medicaginis TaxID=1181271 RepID=A0A850NKY5_9PROT|nr:hypothetical protein [Endobacter medicaginis]MBB3175410.1 hypothetical protein [Endobacter medicaginis]MCX5476885.1 hypothetical protein [Endobacter medicaginis]NVN29574.1 hypothetical protein [Endobacter medicaginis]